MGKRAGCRTREKVWRRSAITGTELRAALVGLKMTQTEFAAAIGATQETISRACLLNAGSVPMRVAMGLRYVQLIHDVQALLDDADQERIGRRRLRAALRRAQVSIAAPTKRKRGPRRRKVKLPVVPPTVVPAVFPVAPAGFYYAWEGRTMVLRRYRPTPDGVI
jgi:hypothetical protein